MVVLRFEMKSLAESLPVDSNPLFVSHLADIIGIALPLPEARLAASIYLLIS